MSKRQKKAKTDERMEDCEKKKSQNPKQEVEGIKLKKKSKGKK